jgi:hypothetical protein
MKKSFSIIIFLLVLANCQQNSIQFQIGEEEEGDDSSQDSRNLMKIIKDILADPEYMALDMIQQLKVLNLIYETISLHYKNNFMREKKDLLYKYEKLF